MAVKNLKSRPVNVVIPTLENAFVKINITDKTGIIYTVMDTYSGSMDSNYCINAKVTLYVTERLSSFDLTLANIEGMFLNIFTGGELVEIFADYTDATTRIFTGKIDNVKYGLNMSDGFYIEIDGRVYPELIDKTITGAHIASTGDVSLGKILYDNYTPFKLSFWNGTTWAIGTYNDTTSTISWDATVTTFPTTLINMEYQEKKGWSIISEICTRIGIDCYAWYDGSQWYLRTFVLNSITNNNAVTYGTNLVSMSEFGRETGDIINRVLVYGNTEGDNILLMKQYEDTTSQTELWIKDDILIESDLTTMDSVKEKSQYELDKGIYSPSAGSVDTIFIPTVKPGELMSVIVPYCGVNGQYRINSITHNFDEIHKTSISLSKTLKTMVDLFANKYNVDELSGGRTNPNRMKDSYTIYFSEAPSIIAHSNTEEVDGKLRLQTGQTSGSATSNNLVTEYDVTSCEFRKYDNYETTLDTYEVSNTGGLTWETYDITSGNIHTFDIPGNSLSIRINLTRASASATSPSYESISLLYK